MAISKITTTRLREAAVKYFSIPKLDGTNMLVNCAIKNMAGKDLR